RVRRGAGWQAEGRFYGPRPEYLRARSWLPPVLQVPMAERLPGHSRHLAMLAPWVERVVENGTGQNLQGGLSDRLGRVKQRGMRERVSKRCHAEPLGDREQSVTDHDAAPCVDLFRDVDLDRTHFGT